MSALRVSMLAFLIVLLLAVASSADRLAEPPGKAPRPVVPDHAVELAPGLFYLGAELHHGQVVEGYALVHYRAKPAKSGKPAPSAKCYDYVWAGVKWSESEPFFVEPSSYDAEMVETMEEAVHRWEEAAGPDIDIIGEGTVGDPDGAAPGVYNGYNEVAFATLSDANAIAVTYMWRSIGRTRLMLEWDQIYNDDPGYEWFVGPPDVAPVWTSTGASLYRVDFQNLATHELGHSVGMADLYTDTCKDETMYGYADSDETSKRDLNDGDIAGVQALY